MARADFRLLTWRQAPLRRAYYHATSKVVLAPVIILALLLTGVLYYYYTRYSAIIDAGLRGDIFVRSSGIYAAPMSLRSGSGISINSLVNHLKNVGYIDNNTAELTQNDRKGRFRLQGQNAVDIFPGPDAVIDGARAFDSIRVTFGPGGGIQSITDIESRQRVNQALVEPELISSVVNQDREKRKIIDYKDLPQSLVDAITTVEDREFFNHSGINWWGVLRAFYKDYQAGELKEGGSSITQQLVKSFFLTPERSWKRKLSEAYMAVILEQRLSKQEIMAMYCNQIYLGQRGGFSVNGFGEAARAYFGKDVAHLDVHESALLGGIIRSPNYYSPFSHEKRAQDRRNKILEMMVETEKLTRDQAEAYKKRPLGLAQKGALDSSDAPYFVDYLTRQLEREYDEGAGSMRSLRIYSTIDLDLQHAAYQSVTRHMAEIDQMLSKRRGGTAGLQAALVAMNAKTGEILAMVGGRNYAESQLNRATDARRQPGSVFKPFVYAAAIGAGADEQNHPITPATVFTDEPRTFDLGNGQVYNPGNFGDKYEYRPVTVRDALVHSKNVIAVQITEQIGFRPIQQLCERAGLTKVPAVTSVALGVGEATPLQLTSAYSAFANGGRRVVPVAIKRVTTKEGHSLFESKTDTREVMTPQVAYVMTSLMQDVLDRGTGTRVRQMGFNTTAAGKTGSSRDGWFAGYTPNLICVVWVGFDDNDDLGLTGGATAAPIWADFMKLAIRLRPDLAGEFEDPGGIVAYEIDPTTGAVASGAPGARRGLFIQGTNTGDGTPVPLPDAQRPDGELMPPGTDEQRPTPTPDSGQAPGQIQAPRDPRIAGLDPDFIPVPPEARDRVRPREKPSPSPGKSILGRITDIFSTPESAAAISPTPRPSVTPRPRSNDSSTPRIIEPSQQPRLASPPPTSRPTPRAPVATRPRRVEEAPRPTASDDRRGKFGKNAPEPRPALAKSLTPSAPARKPDLKKQTEAKKPDPVVAKKAKPTPTPAPRVVVRATPTPTPTPPPAEPAPIPAPTPTPVQGPREKDSFVVEICSVSELLPVPGLCSTKVRRRFTAASVPTKSCNPRFHR